jgi:hypothetical protein
MNSVVLRWRGFSGLKRLRHTRGREQTVGKREVTRVGAEGRLVVGRTDMEGTRGVMA